MSPPSLSNWALVRRMLSLTSRYRWGCMKLVAMQFALLGLGLTALTLVGMAIDTIAGGLDPSAPPKPWPLGLSRPEDWTPFSVTIVLAAIVVIIALVRGLLNYWYAVAVNGLLQQHLVVELRAAVFSRLQQLGQRFYSSHASGSLINRVTVDVQNVRLFVDGVILQMAILALSLAFYLAYMLSIDVGLTIACLATTPVLWYLAIRFSRVVRPAYDRNRQLVDNLLLALSENIRGVQVVKGFARQEEEVARFQAANRAVKDQQQWIFWRISLFTPSVEILMSLNMVVLLAYGGYLVIHGQLALGSGLIVFSGLLQQFSGQVTKVTNIINSVQQSLAGAQRVFEILDTPLEVKSPEQPKRLPRAAGAVEFQNVGFHFKPGRPVLDDISLRVEPGQCVAVLGATGEGKTTLLSLIPRFFDPTHGRVLVDDIDVRDLDLNDLRRNIGIVYQENFLFSDTVAANIAFGHPDATQEQIERAAKIASAHGFIRNLPDGYQTILRESGKDLSGGQRQRLAIARAILGEPPILILDDPTAAIDPQTEEEMLTAMQQAMRGRTTFVVAHRLATLRRADWVIVLEKGRIVEQGTHEELMDRGGVYQRAARLQAEAWQD